MADSSTYTPETLQRRYAMAQALLADPKTPIKHWAEGLNELAKGALGGYQFHNTEKLEAGQREAANQQVMAALGLGGQPATPSAAPAPALTAPVGPVSSAPLAPPGIGGRIVGAESGGEPSAINPNSTASGPGQFIDSTWLETLKKNRPDLAAGKSDAALLAMRTDPAQAGLSRDMTDAYAKQNAGTLSGAGFPVTSGNTYLAHFAGPTGATKILGADPATPVSSLLSPAAIQANPQIANMTAGDIRGWADKQMGGGGSAPPPAVGAIATALNGPAAPAGAPPGMPPAAPAAGAAPSPAVSNVAQTLSAGQKPPLAPPAGVGASPNARAIAAVLTSPWVDPAVKAQVMSQSSPSFGFQTLPDGTMVRTNPKTGQVEPIYQAPTKPTFGEIGEGLGGTKQFGFRDEVNKKVYDINGKLITGETGAGGIPNGPDGNPLQGPDLLKHLEKTDPIAAAGVKGIIAGDINAGGRNLQKLLPLAELIDPTMKQFDYQTRAKTRIDFTSGKSAAELKAINTAIGHADQLAQISPKLGGVDVAPGYLNPLIQGYKRNSGDAEFQDSKRDWDTKAETLATEVSKALNGGTPHRADKEHWREILQAASSPTERRAALKSIMGVLQSRIESNAQTYNQGMGTNREGFTFLNPDNKGKYERLLATGAAEQKPEAGLTAAPAATATTAAPKVPDVGEVRSGYRFKGGNPADKANWEAVQ